MNVYHKSKFTGEEIDQRLAQGTYDDAVKAGFTGTKKEFDQLTWAFGKEQQELLKTAQQQRADDLETESKNVVEAINEIKESVDSISDPYEINLTNLLSADDSESISTAIGGIDNLNATVQDNRIIVGTISNGSVSVSIRILGNVTTLYYLLDSVVGLTLNEIAITNTSGTLSKNITTHSVLTENMVINSLESNETTLPLSAAQGKVLATDKQSKTDNTLETTSKTVVGAINELNEGLPTINLAYCFGGTLNIEFDYAGSTGIFSTSFRYYSFGGRTWGSVTNVSGKTYNCRGIWYIFLNVSTKELEGYHFSEVPSDLTNLYLVAAGIDQSVLFSTSTISPRPNNCIPHSNLAYLVGDNSAVLTIDGTNHTFSSNFQYASLGDNVYVSLVNARNKKIKSRADGSYSGIFLIYYNSCTKGLLGFMSDVAPYARDNYYLVAVGAFNGEGNTICTVNFATCRTSPLPSSVKNEVDTINSAFKNSVKLAFCYQGQITINFKNFTFSTNFTYYTFGGRTFGTVANVTDKSFIQTATSGLWSAYLNSNTKELEIFRYDSVPANLDGYYLVAVGENANTLFSTSRISPSQLGISEKIANLQSQVDAIKPTTPDAKRKVFMSLGDSITTESYYIGKLREILQPSKYYNLAVASATWADRPGTTSYDGNPTFGGDQSQNVLGNQVQKIIDNPETYATAPDIIIIAAGTNDGIPSASELEDSSIEAYFTTNNGSEAVPCTEPTFNSADTYMQMRKKIPGAMRYACSKLAQLYPNARIYILTPIQGCNSSRPYTSILPKQTLITKVAKRMGLPVIHVGEESGIYGDFEYLGSNWDSSLATEPLPKNGRDLRDGLHPNDSGSKKMARYIGREIINDYVASE